MGCQPERVTGYVDGELPHPLAVEAGRHLRACPACAGQARFELGLSALLRSLPEPRLRPEMAAAFASRAHRLAS